MSQKSLLEQVAEFVVTNQVAATLTIQRKMKIGYATVTQLMMDLETIGVVGPYQLPAARQILVSHSELPWVLERVREFEAVNTDD